MESVVERRLLPRAERDLFHYEVVRFHLEDLNLMADRRRARGTRPRSRTAAPDLARVRAIIQAARWNRASFLPAIRRFVDEGRADGDDVFGPALLLAALGSPARAADLGMPDLARPACALAAAVLAEADAGAARPAKTAGQRKKKSGAPREARRAPRKKPGGSARARGVR